MATRPSSDIGAPRDAIPAKAGTDATPALGPSAETGFAGGPAQRPAGMRTTADASRDGGRELNAASALTPRHAPRQPQRSVVPASGLHHCPFCGTPAEALWELNYSTGMLRVGGCLLRLTPIEADILAALADPPGRVLSTDRLIMRV